MARPSTRRSPLITATRGIIAIGIVLFHINPSMPAVDPAWTRPAFGGALAASAGRVEFFFVASAFLAGLRHGGEFGVPGAARSFLRRRALGILPLYWLLLGGLLLIGLSRFGYPAGTYPAPRTIIASFLLVGPDPHDNVLIVAWTLFHELLFYLAFALALANPRWGLALALGWGALVIAGLGGWHSPLPAYIAAPCNLLFGCGLAAAALVRRGHVEPPVLLLSVAAVLALLLVRHPGLAEAVRVLMWGVVWVAVLIAFHVIEQRRTVTLPAPLLWLGSASYMIYLIQFPVLDQFAQLGMGHRLHTVMPVEAGMVAIAAGVVATALLGHHLVERPLQAWLQRPGPPQRLPDFVIRMFGTSSR